MAFRDAVALARQECRFYVVMLALQPAVSGDHDEAREDTDRSRAPVGE